MACINIFDCRLPSVEFHTHNESIILCMLGNFYPPTKSEGYSFGCVRLSVRPFRPSVHTFLSFRKHISVPISQILFIFGTSDKYHGLSISYQIGQNRPLNTWVIALVLV